MREKEPQILLAKQIDYVFEAWQLLILLADEKSVGSSITRLESILKDKYGIESAFVTQYLHLLQQITDQLQESLISDRDRVQLLFGHHKSGYTAFELLFCFHPNDYMAPSHKSAKEAYEYFKGLTEKERDMFYFQELTKELNEDEFYGYMGNDEKGMKVTDAERMRNIFSYIQNMNLTMENREFLQVCYLQRDDYVKEMVKYLQLAISVIEKHKDDLMKIADKWEDYWNQKIQSGHFFLEWNMAIKNTLQHEEKIVVLPGFIQCAVVWINIGSPVLLHDKELLPVCRMGVVLQDDFDMELKVKDEYQVEDIQKKIKLLADKSKFDILLFIKDKPAYGSEIAKHFGLTTATVSHHMNRLLEEQLIIVEQQNKKIYYKANQTVLQNLFEDCSKLLVR